MEPQQYYAGGQEHYFGAGGETHINPIILCVLIVAALLTIFLRRKYVVYPFLLAGILIPSGQVIVVGGLHFETGRILVFFGLLRLLSSRLLKRTEPYRGIMTSIDKLFLSWALSNAIVFTILWGQWGAFVNQAAFLYTYLGIYFVLNFLIRDDEDVERTLKVLASVCLVCALVMVNEQLTGRNVLGTFGGIPLAAMIREGKIRSQAGFPHPLLAGAFGGTMLTAFVGLWWKNQKARKTALIGIIGALVMAITSNSSTSVIAVAAGSLALCLWPLRRSMRLIRRGILVTLVSLHLVMKAPVWALIARIDLTGGSSGYHRFELVDQAIRHFWEWWLVGTRTQAQWGWDMWDSINWYVNQGTQGGLITMILFISIIVYGFKRIGAARKAAEAAGDRRRELFMWALGATLFSNALSFIGIAYYGQATIMWLAFLVIISTATALPKHLADAKAQETIATSRPHWSCSSSNEQ